MTPLNRFLQGFWRWDRESALYIRQQNASKMALETIDNVRIGNLYHFRKVKAKPGHPLDWVVAIQHVDDPLLFFIVPMDNMFTMVGSLDVEIPVEAIAGPGVVRCGCGLWIHVDDVDITDLCGIVEITYIKQIKQKLSDLVTGGSQGLVETDGDPDYDEILESTHIEASRIESYIRGEY